jgi:RNA-directed DNA polymerase
MCASDVKATLDQALAASGLDQIDIKQWLQFLSDNGSRRGISGDLAQEQGHTACARSAVSSPDPRQDQALASDFEEPHPARELLLPREIERQLGVFVEHNNHRYHESIDNLTPADVSFGRAEKILADRERIKRETIATRRLQHQLQATHTLTQDEPDPPLRETLNQSQII